MPDTENEERSTALLRAKALMAEALFLLDTVNALEPGAYLDFAIYQVNVLLGHAPPSGDQH